MVILQSSESTIFTTFNNCFGSFYCDCFYLYIVYYYLFLMHHFLITFEL
jgi:hypothetical protein